MHLVHYFNQQLTNKLLYTIIWLLKINHSRIMKNNYSIPFDIKMFREKHFNTNSIKIFLNLIFILKIVIVIMKMILFIYLNNNEMI